MTVHPGFPRRSRRLARAAGVALAVALGLGPGPARACTCSTPPPFADEFAAASHVFTARTLGSRTAAPEFPDFHYESLLVYAVWKGPVTPVMEVLVADSDGLCGFHFVPGRDVLVFAFPGLGDPPFTHICSRTGSPAAEDPIWSELGPPLTTPAGAPSWGRLKAVYHR
jgi:hypothetical protein